MTACVEYSAAIQLYLDNELSGPSLEASLVHLRGCDACRVQLEAEKSLSALLHQSQPLYVAPDSLRTAIAATRHIIALAASGK